MGTETTASGPADHPSAEAAATQQAASHSPKKPTYLGLDVSNWISLTALVLSLLTAGWAITGYLVGPQVELLPPTSVSFRYWPYGGDSLALTGTTMNYVNTGRKDYDALVISEHVLIAFPGHAEALRLDWWWFVDAFGRGTEQAHPILVPGASVASHETRFAPTLKTCAGTHDCPKAVAYSNYMQWLDFLDLARDSQRLPHLEITFVAKVRERGYREVTKGCLVAFNDMVREELSAELKKLQSGLAAGMRIGEIKNRKEYFSLPCVAQHS